MALKNVKLLSNTPWWGGEDQFVLFDKLTSTLSAEKMVMTVVYLGHEHRPKTLSGRNKTT